MRIKSDDGKIGAGVRPLYVRGVGGITTSQDIRFAEDILTITGGDIGVHVPFSEAILTLAGTRTLLGYWRFGDAGSPFLDSSGNGYDAVKVSTGVAMTTGITGALPAGDDDGAVQYNSPTGAAGDYLYNSERDWWPASLTVAAWVKPFSSSSTWTGVIGESSIEFTGFEGWRLGMEWPLCRPSWFRRITDSATQTYLIGPALPPNTWSFVVGTYSATNGSRLYVNGALIAADPRVLNMGGSNSLLFFSRTSDTFTPKGFYGGVDEMSVWASELTADEIGTLTAAGGLATSASTAAVSTAVNYTASTLDSVIFASGTTTITLYTAVGNLGRQITVKNVGVGTVTVDGNGSETIDGEQHHADACGRDDRRGRDENACRERVPRHRFRRCELAERLSRHGRHRRNALDL